MAKSRGELSYLYFHITLGFGWLRDWRRTSCRCCLVVDKLFLGMICLASRIMLAGHAGIAIRPWYVRGNLLPSAALALARRETKPRGLLSVCRLALIRAVFPCPLPPTIPSLRTRRFSLSLSLFLCHPQPRHCVLIRCLVLALDTLDSHGRQLLLVSLVSPL